MCWTTTSRARNKQLDKEELSLLPDTMKISAMQSTVRRAVHRNVGLLESVGLISLGVTLIYAAITNGQQPISLICTISRLRELKRPVMWAMAVLAFNFARKSLSGRSMPKALGSIRRTFSKNSIQAATRLSNVARASSAAKLSQLSGYAVKCSMPWQNRSCDSGVASSSRKCTMSAAEPFVSREVLAQMTLTDITTAVRYAVECSDSDAFQKEQSPLMQEILSAMDRAACESRGDVAASPEGVDAILFCAVMRIFAEWRALRQVPPGFKGYEMGMSLGRRDMIQNLAKLEAAAHSWMDSKTDEDDKLHSPALQQLLEHEIDTNVHENLPRLKDTTAAIGLLWIKRQLHYQASVYTNLAQVPAVFKDTSAAVHAAYQEVFRSYHGWFIQQMFGQSYRGAPPTLEIFKFMNPSLLEQVTQEQESIPSLDSSFSSFDSDDWASSMSDHDMLACDDDEHENPENCILFGGQLFREWDRAGKHIQGEFGKFVQFAVSAFQGPKQQSLTIEAMQTHDSMVGMATHDTRAAFRSAPRGEAYIQEVITKDAHAQIRVFLETTQPFLAELSSVMEALNMNDPTKV